MVSEGRFPFPGGQVDSDSSPRAGDGLVRLDADGRVSYASPNAVSGYRRLGWTGDLVGADFGASTAGLAPTDGPVEESIGWLVGGGYGHESSVEIEARGVALKLRTIPLLPGGERVGTLVLLRDVTDLRRRERALVSKDATIREIHHRVKNNLADRGRAVATQARRMELPEGRAALEEAVRRVRAIALVHETLSQTLDGPIDFDEVADRLIAMVGEVAAAETAPARSLPRRVGSFGQLPTDLATPLSMVLTELLQNALEHGLRGRSGVVEVTARRHDHELEIAVADDGEGLPIGFSLSASPRLGLQIVQNARRRGPARSARGSGAPGRRHAGDVAHTRGSARSAAQRGLDRARA